MTKSIELSLIVARALNGAIGKNGDLPWRLADDLAFFKATTSGCPIIMGRKTWESLPRRPLPNRDNIVVTRNWAFQAPAARVLTGLDSAIETGLALANASGQSEAFIIGGETLYEAALPFATRLYISEVDAVVEGDAFFPNFDEAEFVEVERRDYEANARNQYGFTTRILARRPGATAP